MQEELSGYQNRTRGSAVRGNGGDGRNNRSSCDADAPLRGVLNGRWSAGICRNHTARRFCGFCPRSIFRYRFRRFRLYGAIGTAAAGGMHQEPAWDRCDSGDSRQGRQQHRNHGFDQNSHRSTMIGGPMAAVCDTDHISQQASPRFDSGPRHLVTGMWVRRLSVGLRLSFVQLNPNEKSARLCCLRCPRFSPGWGLCPI
jgi:hypothetical protein